MVSAPYIRPAGAWWGILMTSLRAMLFLAAIAVSALFTYACNGEKCGPASCSTGCCDEDGECRSGLLDATCGTAGNACLSCSGVEVCQGGTCVALGAQNTDGGNPNASCLQSCTGCCTGGQCLPGNEDTACGRGDVCEACGSGEQCVDGECVLQGCDGCKATDGTCDESGADNASACGLHGVACQSCGANSCVGGVCTGCTGCYTDLGLCEAGTTRALCGTGGAVCAACGEHEACTSGVCVQTCKSNGAACAVGAECCSDTCDGSVCVAPPDGGMCKSNGAACAVASECCSNACTGGVCGTAPPDAGSCGPSSCQGCCSASGACEPGTSAGACGSAGEACAACGSGQVCTTGIIGGVCEGSGGSCSSLGQTCSNGSQCCTAFCSGGQCAPNPNGGVVTTCGAVIDICAMGGKPSSPGCDPCVAKICEQDGYCCETQWDDECVKQVNGNCDNRCAP